MRDPVTAADWRCWRYWRGTGTLSDWEEEHFLPSARRVLLDRQEHSATPELVSPQVSLRCCKDEVFVV